MAARLTKNKTTWVLNHVTTPRFTSLMSHAVHSRMANRLQFLPITVILLDFNAKILLASTYLVVLQMWKHRFVPPILRFAKPDMNILRLGYKGRAASSARTLRECEGQLFPFYSTTRHWSFTECFNKTLDARRSTFNDIGRDQYNQHSCYNTFVVHHHHNYIYPRGTQVCDTVMFIGPPAHEMVERTIQNQESTRKLLLLLITINPRASWVRRRLEQRTFLSSLRTLWTLG